MLSGHCYLWSGPVLPVQAAWIGSSQIPTHCEALCWLLHEEQISVGRENKNFVAFALKSGAKCILNDRFSRCLISCLGRQITTHLAQFAALTGVFFIYLLESVRISGVTVAQGGVWTNNWRVGSLDPTLMCFMSLRQDTMNVSGYWLEGLANPGRLPLPVWMNTTVEKKKVQLSTANLNHFLHCPLQPHEHKDLGHGREKAAWWTLKGQRCSHESLHRLPSRKKLFFFHCVCKGSIISWTKWYFMLSMHSLKEEPRPSVHRPSPRRLT